MSEDFSGYIPACTVQTAHAQRIVQSLADAGVRLAIEPDNSAIQSLSALEASSGGTFGSGATVVLHVHPEDWEIYDSTYAELFDDFYHHQEEEVERIPNKKSTNTLWIIGSVAMISMAFYISEIWQQNDRPTANENTGIIHPTPRKTNPKILAEFEEGDKFIKRVLKEDEEQDAPEEAPVEFPPQQ